MQPFKHFRTAATIALLTVAAGAQADTVSLRDAGNDQVLATHLSVSGTDLNVYVGSYLLQQEGQAGSFAAYCVDPFQTSSPSFQPYDRSPLAAANLPAVQTDRFAAVSKLFGNAYAGSLTSATKAAGFQLALLELWYDDGVLTTGTIQTLGSSDPGMVAEAQYLLDSVAGWSVGTTYDLTLFSNATYQDYVTAVPEPSTYALLVAGLGMLGTIVRRSATRSA